MDTDLSSDAASETVEVLAHKTCDSHMHCEGPSVGHTRLISNRDKGIVGSILGGTAIIVVACLFVWRWREKKAKRQDEERKRKGKEKQKEMERDVSQWGSGLTPPGLVRSERGGEGDDEIRPLPQRSISWEDR
ncbi:hypothetical protein F5Y07DRAFT_396253 [Xylaria sp. FL0933]|nr:hypothetical protein F5Y07DRAFT_396253 [Xylaria sp. FL0933]